MATVSENQIKEALGKRKHDIADNLETLTLKKLRQELAEDLSVDESAIKEHKDFLVKAVDEIVTRAHKRAKLDVSDEKQSPSIKAAKTASKKQAGSPAPRKKVAKKAAAPKAAPKSTDSAVQKLKDMCKEATIMIPPALYKRASDTDELVQELEALLDKHGLTRSSGSREIAVCVQLYKQLQACTCPGQAVKAKLTKDKELEGIDLGNIIEETGRRRRAATAPVDYKKMAHVSTSDEEDEEEDDDDDSDEDSEVGSEAGDDDAEEAGEGAGEDAGEEEAGEGAQDPEDAQDAEPLADIGDDVPPPSKKGKRAVLESEDDSL